MVSAESEARALIESQAEAVRAKDIDRLMSLYSPDVIYFDVVPPLQFVGAAALRGRFSQWFDGFEGTVDMDIRDLHVAASDSIAVATWLSRVSGTLKNGRRIGSWVRATSCSQRSPHGWLVIHEHISLPVDVANGRPAMDLEP